MVFSCPKSEPQYTEAELAEIRRQNEKGVTVEGQHYSMYEAAQKQRQIEGAIRTQKRRVTVAENQPDEENLQSQQIRLQTLKQRYQDFCRKTGLKTEDERLFVSGLGRKEVARAAKSGNTVALDGMTYAQWKKNMVISTGQGAGKSNSGEESPGFPKLVGKVDFQEKEAVLQVLSDAEKELSAFQYEVNYTVTATGEVWRTEGVSAEVHPENIPRDLKGSYSYHNHPAEETHYSFSAEDVSFFFERGQEYSKASDDVFEYVMRRTEKTLEKPSDEAYHRFKEIVSNEVMEMKWIGSIDPDVDEYHEAMKILSRELNFDYERTEKCQ